MPDQTFLSIIIPAYNEEHRIGVTLEALATYLKDKKYSYEIILVDDGSIDQTIPVAKTYSHLFQSLQIIRDVVNKGKGYAVKKGMKEASGLLRLFLDADNSVKITELDNFIARTENGADVVIGSIEVPGSSIKDANQIYRRLLGKLAKFLIRKIAAPGVHDTQRGFKLFSKKAADIVFGLQTIDRWGFDIEIIAIAQRNHLKIDEVPVEWDNPKTAAVGIMSYYSTFFELLKIKSNLIKGKYDRH